MRLLLVEDERKVASFIARTLRENSYAVDIAETGERPLELAKDISEKRVEGLDAGADDYLTTLRTRGTPRAGSRTSSSRLS